jgi:hypothetical protein
VLAIGLTPDVALRGKTMTMTALRDEVGTPGTAATDTRASITIALTRVWLDALARILGDRRDAALGHFRSRPPADLQTVQAGVQAAAMLQSVPCMSRK